MTTDAPRPQGKRADAVRHVEWITDAAIVCLSQRQNATMSDIAREVGLGRVTLYGRFASRAEFIDAVVARVIEGGENALAAVDLDQTPAKR